MNPPTPTTTQRWQRTPIRNEASWIPRSFDDVEDLRERLIEAGHSAAIVNGLTGWLMAKALGHVDETSASTRTRYRKVLAELGTGPYPDNDPRLLRDAGHTNARGLAAALAGVGGFAMALAPIIDEQPRYDALPEAA